MIVSSVLAVAFIAAGASAQTTAGCTQAVRNKCVNATASICLTDTCSGATTGGPDFKNTMLSKHLYYRKQAFRNGSKGADMMNLEWDDQLAAGAMAWVQKLCSTNKFEHDTNLCRATARYDSVGQNLAWADDRKYSEDVLSATLAVEGWYNETEKQPIGKMFPFDRNDPTGHYTAVVWSRSYKIGCALVRKPGTYGTEAWIACNYSPAGNMRGMNWNVFNPGKEVAEKCRPYSAKGPSGLCEVIAGQEESYRKDVRVNNV